MAQSLPAPATPAAPAAPSAPAAPAAPRVRPARQRRRMRLPRSLDDIQNLISGPNLIRIVVLVVLVMLGSSLASTVFHSGTSFTVENIGNQHVQGFGVDLDAPPGWGVSGGGALLDPPLMIIAPRAAGADATTPPTTISAYAVDITAWLEEQRNSVGQLPSIDTLLDSYTARELVPYAGAQVTPAFYNASTASGLLLPARLITFAPNTQPGLSQQVLLALPDTPELRQPNAMALLVVLSYPSDTSAADEAALLSIWEQVRASLVLG